MTAITQGMDNTADREIVITRLINTPHEPLWEVLIDPQRVAHWWWPTGFSTTIEKMDLRVGGVWYI